MRVNHKEVLIFIFCLALVITTREDLLARFPGWAKDMTTLLALAVVATQNKIFGEHPENTNE